MKYAARIGETAFTLLRIDHVCCLFGLGTGGFLLDARDQGLAC